MMVPSFDNLIIQLNISVKYSATTNNTSRTVLATQAGIAARHTGVMMYMNELECVRWSWEWTTILTDTNQTKPGQIEI